MISCQDYDYIEIACMHRYPIKLTLKTGETVTGTAFDTALNKSKQECLLILAEGKPVEVVLDEIAVLEVTIENRHFQQVSLS